MYFNISKNVCAQGIYLYKKYKMLLIEAQGIIISDNYYNYEDTNKRILLNYAVGFMKLEIEKEKIKKNG